MSSTITIRLLESHPEDFDRAREARDAVALLIERLNLSALITVSDDLRSDEFAGIESRLIGVRLPEDLDYCFDLDDYLCRQVLRTLREAGITTLSQLLEQTPSSLRKLAGFGEDSLECVQQHLKAFKLSLTADPRGLTSLDLMTIDELLPSSGSGSMSRARVLLAKAGYQYVGDLTRVTEDDLLGIEGLGPAILLVIQTQLRRCGLSLRQD